MSGAEVGLALSVFLACAAAGLAILPAILGAALAAVLSLRRAEGSAAALPPVRMSVRLML
jgi:hypothetical protein